MPPLRRISIWFNLSGHTQCKFIYGRGGGGQTTILQDPTEGQRENGLVLSDKINPWKKASFLSSIYQSIMFWYFFKNCNKIYILIVFLFLYICFISEFIKMVMNGWRPCWFLLVSYTILIINSTGVLINFNDISCNPCFCEERERQTKRLSNHISFRFECWQWLISWVLLFKVSNYLRPGIKFFGTYLRKDKLSH